MPFQIDDPQLEQRLEEHASRQVVRPAKSRLLFAIANASLDAADAAGIDVGQIIQELRNRITRKKQKGKRIRA